MDKSPYKWKCPWREVLQVKFVLQLSWFDCLRKELQFDSISVLVREFYLTVKKGPSSTHYSFKIVKNAQTSKTNRTGLISGRGIEGSGICFFDIYSILACLYHDALRTQDSWAGRSSPPPCSKAQMCPDTCVYSLARTERGNSSPFVLGPSYLDKSRTQTAVINTFNLLIFRNLTCRMLVNIYLQKYRYNFENFTYMIVKRDWGRD